MEFDGKRPVDDGLGSLKAYPGPQRGSQGDLMRGLWPAV
jgi:hypothetical protein